MVVRRDQRRRRVMMDEATRVAIPESIGTSMDEPVTRVEKAVEEPRQQLYSPRVRGKSYRTTDLLPKKPQAYLALCISLVLILSGLNTLGWSAPGLRTYIGDEGVAALRVIGPGSIGNWLVGLLMTLSAMVCLQIFALRKHRVDDYRGTYRIWAWAAALFFLASLGCVVPLGEILTHLLLTVAKPEYVKSLLLIVCVQLVVASFLYVRALSEIWASRGTVWALSLSWVLVVCSISLQLPSISDSVGESAPTVKANLIVGSAMLLFMTAITFGRFVYLQSRGLISRQIQTRDLVANKMEQATESTSGTDRAQKRKKPKRQKTAPAPPVAESTEEPTNSAEVAPVEAGPPPVPTVSDAQAEKLKLLAEAQARVRERLKKEEDLAAVQEAQSGNATRMDDSEQDLESVDENRKMSKSEMRKLRKQQKQQRRQKRRAA